MRKTPLFKAGTGGYALQHIPGIVCLPDQTLLAYCEARRTREWGDWADIDILLRRGAAGGESWLPRQRLAGRQGVTTNNPVMLVDARAGLVHCLHSENYYRCLHRWSADGGRTFSKPVDITYALERLQARHPWNVIAFGPGHGIQLRGGRLLLPFWCALGHKAPNGHPRAYDHHPSFCGALWSDDHGDTWDGAAVAARNTPEHPDPNEAAVAELSDGRVMMNIRSEAPGHRRLVTISSDGGATWETPYFDEALYDPVCFAGLCATPPESGARWLLFSNPASQTIPSARHQGWGRRMNLTLRASLDDGATWPLSKVVEAAGGGYSDLAADNRGRIFCLYGGGDPDDPEAYLGQITLATLDRDELSEKQS